MLKRVLSIVLISHVLLTNLPLVGLQDTYAATFQSEPERKEGGAAEVRKRELESVYSVSDEDIQALLDQGYSLDDVAVALEDQRSSGGQLADSLNKVRPQFANTSEEAKSTITSNVGTVSYAATEIKAAAAPPDYSYVQTKPDEAPYSVRLNQETISTLSGGVSLQASDLSLPGRNGLGFTLTRKYDSGESQLNQMVTYGDSNSTIQPFSEKYFPIGKGWSWNLSYIEINGSNKFLHLAGSGVYEIVNNNLLGNPWKDLTFSADTSVTVNSVVSAYSVKSIQGITQHFDSLGHLIQISDPYENKITFSYISDATYGTVLNAISDSIGNSITIAYSTTSVVLTKGSEIVKYNKSVQNGKELLGQVIDPLGRTTTYDYTVKDAQFNLLGTSPNTSNPYALLTGVTHPTGGKTVYTYEENAVTRYIGANKVNQVFRMQSRKDQINGSSEKNNHKDITYPSGDMGIIWGSDNTFSVMISDGLSQTTFNNKRDFIDDNIPAAFYNTNITAVATQNGVTYTNKTDYTYAEASRYPVPLTTTETRSASNTSNLATYDSSKVYDPYGNVTSSTDIMGITTLYAYDNTSHLLNSVTKPISSSKQQFTTYFRNKQGTVTQVQVYEGSSTAGTLLQQIGYENIDGYGNVRQIRVKNGTTENLYQTQYDTAVYKGAFPTMQAFTVRNADGQSSTITKQYEYNPSNGRLTKYTDGNSNVTQYQYDALGRVLKATHQADGSYVTVNYVDGQNQIQTTDETGIISVTNWNPLGWKTDAGILDRGIYKAKAKYGYDTNGRLTWTEDALGNRISYGYDQWSRQNQVTNPDATKAGIFYDDMTNTKTSTDAEGYAIKEYYDKAGRTKSKEETKKVAAGTQTTTLGTFTYDYAGHMLTATDNVTPQHTTTYSYDVLGQLTSVLNAKSELTSYQYDNVGNLLQVTYPDGKTNLKKYDEIGRLIQTTDANSKLEKFFYDANGNQTGLLDRNSNRFKYTFDNRNFLIKKEVTDAAWNPLAGEETIGFKYDLAGRRTEMNDGTGTTKYAFNSSTGALNTQTYPDGKTIKYDYDAAGNRFVMNDPFGVNTYYHYDSRNRLDIVAPSADFLKDTETTKTTDYDAKYTYYKNSLLKQITHRNGVTSDFGYDGLRIGSLTEKKSDGTTLNTFAYTYDNNGNQKTKTENGTTNNFNYDQLNRISTSDQFNESYGYDNRGNRTSMTTNNPFESPDSARTFDKRDRLNNVALASGGNVSYKYNGDGLLYERTENGQTTRYYWDGSQVIAEGNVVGGIASLKARYVRGQGLIAREDGQGKAYYLQNGHGDVVNLMDSTGRTKLNSYSYDIWGNIVSQQENIPQPFKYSGEMMDDKVGLQYLRARWYDPSMGRFVGEDSYGGQIDNPLSLNRFTYVSNNPLIYTDPTGHEQEGDKDLLGPVGYQRILELTEAYKTAIRNKADAEWAHDYYHGLAETIRKQYGTHTVIINNEEKTFIQPTTVSRNSSPNGSGSDSSGRPSSSSSEPSEPYDRKAQKDLIDNVLDSEEAREAQEIVVGMYTGGVKGKSFRGGNKNTRDNWYGYSDSEFQKWWHREGKRDFGGDDIEDAQHAREIYEAWVAAGKPKVK
ncbi:RHS repeat-associated core domain-containing protein [Paenibacillus sp. SYP-B3998]|nr:RHS repeat-associated core domain-containing protein [Paenibacillus sp. SYP-B3998]